MQGTASETCQVGQGGDVASLEGAGLSIPLMPKYQCTGSRKQGLGDKSVTKVRGTKGLKDPP